MFLIHPQEAAGGGGKEQGSNTIIPTSFAMKFRSNEIIDVNIILTLIHSWTLLI